MPPTFLLFLGGIILAANAPIIFLALTAMIFLGKGEATAKKYLKVGVVSGGVLASIWVAGAAAIGGLNGNWLVAPFVFGAGFSGSVALVIVCRRIKRTFFNPSLHTDPSPGQ